MYSFLAGISDMSILFIIIIFLTFANKLGFTKFLYLHTKFNGRNASISIISYFFYNFDVFDSDFHFLILCYTFICILSLSDTFLSNVTCIKDKFTVGFQSSSHYISNKCTLRTVAVISLLEKSVGDWSLGICF